MSTRVTFRIAEDLAATLRELPNQTKFVESALRDALGRTCAICSGTGRVPMRALEVTNLRDAGIRPLKKPQAQQLQKVFRLGQQVAATQIALEKDGRRVKFTMSREGTELLNGTLDQTQPN